MKLKKMGIKNLCVAGAVSFALIVGSIVFVKVVKKGYEEKDKQMIETAINNFIDDSIDNLNIHIPGVFPDVHEEYNLSNFLLNYYGEYLDLDKAKLLKEERFSFFTRVKDQIDKQDNIYEKEKFDELIEKYDHHNYSYPSSEKKRIDVYSSMEISSFKDCMNGFIFLDNPGIDSKNIKYIVEDSEAYILVDDNKYLVDNENLSRFIKAYKYFEDEDLKIGSSVEYQYMDDLMDGIIAGAVFKMELKDKKLSIKVNNSGAYIKK